MNIEDTKLIIFDLDLTLVDSKEVKKYRDAGRWKQVFGMVSGIAPYPGISELLRELYEARIRIAIVTSSPDMYCKKIIDHQKWNEMISKKDVVGYHQTTKKKPSPEPIHKMLEYTNISAENTVHVGDEPKDTQAAKSAGVFAIGAGWGTLNFAELAHSKPDFICQTVEELRVFWGLE